MPNKVLHHIIYIYDVLINSCLYCWIIANYSIFEGVSVIIFIKLFEILVKLDF